jgi:hypothetical protein
MLGVYGAAQAEALACDTGTTCTLDSEIEYNSVIVNAGEKVTGTDTKFAGTATNLVLVNQGGTLALTDAVITNTLGSGLNGRAVKVTGTGATAELIESKVTLTTDANQQYDQSFTAAVGTENGGHANIVGGSIKASGNNRTVGIQANDGGSITADGVTIETNSALSHAVNAYSNPDLANDTRINLKNVTISTLDHNFAAGISSANQGAHVEAENTHIVTLGTNSFGAMVFNGATVSLTNSSIATSGENAFGIYAYTGNMGEDSATLTNTDISTNGEGAIGVLANLDATVSMTGGTITTNEANSPGVVAISGGTVNKSES